MALRIFDTETMDYREATQVDIDILEATRAAYGRIQGRFAEDRAILLEELRTIRSKAGMPFAVPGERPTGDI